MNSLLLWIGGLLCAVLSLLFAAPYLVDWNTYRGVFEEEASRILGRDVRVGGKVNLRLLPSPFVRFEKVRISDSGASLGEPFFRAEAFTLWLSPTPLLKGAFEASEIELDRPVLRLAIDAEGRGNWQALKVSPGALPFVPSDVVLQQVRIRDGVVSLRTPSYQEPLTLSGIDGEVAAASLDGPFRFRGLVDWYGTRRELRIGTGQRETDGKLRYKASVRSTDNGNVYSLDGLLSEMSVRGRHTGTLSARLPLSTVFGGMLPTDSRTRAARGNESIDIKSNFEGDIDGARLTDLTFAFEQDGKPQLMNGELAASWRQGQKIETRLASRWLDLDLIFGADGRNAAPAETFRRLIPQLSALLAREGSSLLTVDVEQINLGGEALSGARLALARSGGITSIGELRATLPGNARGELRGLLGSSAADPTSKNGITPAVADAFDGEILLRGASYRRFAAWAGAQGLLGTAPAGSDTSLTDAPFSIASRLRLLPDAVLLDRGQLEIGQNQVTADLNWRRTGSVGLEINVTGRAIDLGPFVPHALSFARAPGSGAPPAASGQRLLDTGSAALASIADRVAAIERSVGMLKIKLQTGELTDGETSLRDVNADLTVRSGGISIANLGMSGHGGPRAELQGELRDLHAKPQGSLRGWLAASSAQAMAPLFEALPTGARELSRTWLAQADTAELGFTLNLGGQSPDLVTLDANGTIGAAKVVARMHLEGGLAQWREAPLSLALDVDEPAPSRLVQRLWSRRAAGTPAAASSIEHASLKLRAAGANSRSIVTEGNLAARSREGTTSAAFNGMSLLDPGNNVELAGDIALVSTSAADILALAGANTTPFLPGTAVRGTVSLQRKTGSIVLTTSGLQVGASHVGGRITLSDRDTRTRLDGLVTADRLSLTGLLGLVMDGRPSQPARGDTGPADDPLPAAALTLGLLDNLEGQLVVTAPVAALTPALEIGGAEARFAINPGRVELQSLTGAALGGRVNARGTLEPAQTGANLALDMRMTGLQLSQLAATSPGTTGASGEANVTFSLAGRGLTARAALSAATGKGEIEIRNGQAQGIAAALIEKTAQAALEANEGMDRTALERQIATERGRSIAVIGNRKLAIDIADGAARIAPLELTSPEATLKNTTTVDLAQLKFDSEWQIQPRRPLPAPERSQITRREPLPAIGIVWTGLLGGLARSEPRLSIEQLERELTIRRMERDAEKLEQLRRQDEERAREIERQNRSEAPAGTNMPTAAPAIQAPFAISPQAAPVPSASNAPAVAPSQATPPLPPPRVVRPPPPRQQGQVKSLQDLLMGQQ